MTSAVKSRIATYEAQSRQTARSTSPAIRRPRQQSSPLRAVSGASSDSEAANKPGSLGHSPVAPWSTQRRSNNRSSYDPSVISGSTSAPSSIYSHQISGSPMRNGKGHLNGVPFVNNNSNKNIMKLQSLSKDSSVGSSASKEELYTSEEEDLTSTKSASESRRSRIRQQLLENSNANRHPVDLMEKRKLIKERRMRAAEASGVMGPATPTRSSAESVSSSPSSPGSSVKYSSATTTATAAANGSKLVSRRMIASHKPSVGWKTSPSPSSPERPPPDISTPPRSRNNVNENGGLEEKPQSPRLSHFHGTNVVTPTQSEDTGSATGKSVGRDAPLSHSAVAHQEYLSDEQTASSGSPIRKTNESRRAKMKRMHRGHRRNNDKKDSKEGVDGKQSLATTETQSATIAFAPGNNEKKVTTSGSSMKPSKVSAPENSRLHPDKHTTSLDQTQAQQPLAKKATITVKNKKKEVVSKTSISIPATNTQIASKASSTTGGGKGRRSNLREEVKQRTRQQQQEQLPSHQVSSSTSTTKKHKMRASSPAPVTPEDEAQLFEGPMHSPPESPAGVMPRAGPPLEPTGITLSPIGKDPYTQMHSGMSPRSGTDVCSDALDQSIIDPSAMDDDATLTSVRRIMAAKSTPSRDNHNKADDHSDNPYDHEHHLQTQQQRQNRENNGNSSRDIVNQKSISSKRGSVFRNHPADERNNSPMTNFRGGSASMGTSNFSSSRNRHSRMQRRNSGNSNNSSRRQRYHSHQTEWMEDEKSDKAGGGVFRTASSSDYGSDGEISKNSRQSNPGAVLEGPSNSQATDVNEFFNSRGSRYSRRGADDDDRTFDYGDREEDESNGSASYGTRRRKEAERRAREAAAGRHENSRGGNDSNKAHGSESPLINQDDVEHYTRSLDTPAFKVGVGVVGAATVGCMLVGPVGLLVGAAAVGIGVGVMQIPEEQRSNMQERAKQTFDQIHDKALDATESLSSSCMATYKDSGVADHIPHCLSGSENGDVAANNKDLESTHSADGRRVRTNDGNASTNGGAPNHHANNLLMGPDGIGGGPASATSQNSGNRARNKKVACLRDVGIIPPSQIHGLDPAAQPRAWLDVMASAETSEDEKNEAMEEIAILAKDKRRARIFLDEGILDSLMWILNRYFEKAHAKGNQHNWAHPELTPNQRRAAKLSATCCVTLGKAHCAAFHTEGDLLLMSLYERGTVPEERQVAQMLHEVPHHVRVTKTTDPTIVEPSQEVFALKQMTLPQAEELARAIKQVADN